MRVVAALGGNALLRRGEPLDPAAQLRNVEAAAESLAALATEHELIVTHGNGPQVGLLALQTAASAYPFPLDVLGAETEGMIGYLIEQALGNRLPDRSVTAVLTRTQVDAHDPAFGHPTKPVGPVCDERAARSLAVTHGWDVALDGKSWRRVVPSPEPLRIVEIEAIEVLLGAGGIVVCAGGGGIPVARGLDGRLRGVEAVIDKDLAAARLACELRADALLLLTDVEGILAGWPDPAAPLVRTITPDELDHLDLPAGSMAPKAQAAARFAQETGGIAAIGALTDAEALLRGEAGTVVQPRVSAEVVA